MNNNCKICNQPTQPLIDVLNYEGEEYIVHDGQCQETLLNELEHQIIDTPSANLFSKAQTPTEEKPNDFIQELIDRKIPKKTPPKKDTSRSYLSIQLVDKKTITSFRKLAKESRYPQNYFFESIIDAITEYKSTKNDTHFLNTIKKLLN